MKPISKFEKSHCDRMFPPFHSLNTSNNFNEKNWIGNKKTDHKNVYTTKNTKNLNSIILRVWKYEKQ